jgi:hypothetical protein
MCVDCVLASLRIAQVDTGDEPLPEVVLSHIHADAYLFCDEVLPCIVFFLVEVVHSLNLNLDQNGLNV